VTAPLLNALATGTGVNWIKAKVSAISVTEHTVTLSYRDATVPHIQYLNSYIPEIGDTVHVLVHPGMGMLILGKQVPVLAVGAAPSPDPTTILPNRRSTWNKSCVL
jgi:hypothetical protein